MNKNITIQFHETELVCVETPDGVFVAVKPICEAIGLNWQQQHKTICANPILGPASCLYTMQVGGQGREMFCLPMDYVHGWLFSIEANRVSDEARPLLLTYQRECYKALKEYFTREQETVSPALAAHVKRVEALQAELEAWKGQRSAIDKKIYALTQEIARYDFRAPLQAPQLQIDFHATVTVHERQPDRPS